MIQYFDTLFAGYVDLEDVGYGGTPVNDRSYSDEYLATAFDKAEAIARLMDRTGYDTLWLAEHHFQPEGYECIPNIMILAVHLAHLTRRLNFGCGFNITPMWHPLRLAEDYAMADILTKGRLRFGVGRGCHTREVETFGAPLLDQQANRELFEEQVDVVHKAIKERPFSHHGKYYNLPPAVPYRDYTLKELTLVPRPLYRPFECWQPIQSATPRGLDFMVKHGIKGVIGGGVAEGGALRRVVEAWRDAQGRAGHDVKLGENLSIGFHFYIADSQKTAIKEASAYYEENLKVFGPLRLVRSMTEQQIADMADPKKAPYAGLPTMEDAVKAGAVLCGPPESIIEKLKGIEEAYPGLDRVSMGLPVSSPQKMWMEQLERLAKEVMPAFAKKAQAATGEG
ncbi:MAG: LLM class flavin-dependent oxidoreductase [SAR202 cluster bacterium]|nr:LLM class flavin-dependent oxidoreductase [SAR202 cluster bacterium]